MDGFEFLNKMAELGITATKYIMYRCRSGSVIYESDEYIRRSASRDVFEDEMTFYVPIDNTSIDKCIKILEGFTNFFADRYPDVNYSYGICNRYGNFIFDEDEYYKHFWDGDDTHDYPWFVYSIESIIDCLRTNKYIPGSILIFECEMPCMSIGQTKEEYATTISEFNENLVKTLSEVLSNEE